MNGCYNREPFKRTLRVQDGWMEFGATRKPVIRSIPFRMSEQCEYTTSDLGAADPGCKGCRWQRQSSHEMQQMRGGVRRAGNADGPQLRDGPTAQVP